ncbi:CsbD family protein [Lentzea sp. NPDC102401]|uniref:CsbD family protein n=1 Tax=Lentzea sp. NPDC102401 TaxID=3364128 RepID=UPI0037F4677B
MSLSDKISNKAEDLGGKVKETAGEVTGDDELRGEGIADQAKAAVKDVVEDVKDALGTAAEKVKAALHKD